MSQQNQGNLYILFTAILWSTGGILIKYIPGNAMMINGGRSLVALVFFWLYKRNMKVKVNKKIFAAAICLLLTNLLFVIANKLTTAANAIVLQYTAPIFVLVWDCIYRKSKPRKYQFLVVGMAFAGMILFFLDQLDGGKLTGNVIAICAGLCFSGVYFINSLPDSSSEDASMIAFGLSFLIAIPFMGDVFTMDGTAVLALLALGIFQVGLAYVCIFCKRKQAYQPCECLTDRIDGGNIEPGLGIFILRRKDGTVCPGRSGNHFDSSSDKYNSRKFSKK